MVFWEPAIFKVCWSCEVKHLPRCCPSYALLFSNALWFQNLEAGSALLTSQYEPSLFQEIQVRGDPESIGVLLFVRKIAISVLLFTQLNVYNETVIRLHSYHLHLI